MPTVSVIIPTHKRPDLLARAIRSVLAQSYADFEIIVVDDDPAGSAEPSVASFSDRRIRYLKNEGPRHGGSAARNAGIRAARGAFIAFLDDDDQWLPEKLEMQYEALRALPSDVGFCVTGAQMEQNGPEVITHVEDGVHDFSEIALRRFKGFLTITLFIRREVFDEVGSFDEEMPSHQEAELIIRVTRKYKGLGIDRPLAIANMTPHEHIGGNLDRRIAGRARVLTKQAALFAARPRVLARHYFQMGLWNRDMGRSREARRLFLRAFGLSGNLRYLLHAVRSLR